MIESKGFEIWTNAQGLKSKGRVRSIDNISLEGIARLRELILELAVQGKLTSQSNEDIPVPELLKIINKKNLQSIEEGKSKKIKALPKVEENEYPFSLPKGWKFVRLNEIGEWGSGATPNRGNPDYYGGNIPWIKSGELNFNFIDSSEEYITEKALKETAVRYNNIGDVLIAMYGATIGKTSILKIRATTNQAICACTPFYGIENTFLLTLLKAYKNKFIRMGTGGAQPNISREKIIYTVIGLPPTEEQKRIVIKVDELMSLCDKLENQQTKSLFTHQILVKTLLGTLTSASDSDKLQTAWNKISEHFDTLFYTQDSIEQLKQTILQLAVMGKLVSQDPRDEPSSELISKIKKEKDKLVEEGKIKKQNELDEINNEEKPYPVPESWSWVRLGNISNKIGSGSTPRGGNNVYTTSGILFLRSQNIRNEGLLLDDVVYIDEEVNQKMSNTVVLPNDILLNITGGSLGRCTIFPIKEKVANVSQHVTIIRPTILDSVRYLHKCILSPYIQSLVWGRQIGANREGLSKKILEQFEIPYPPLEEQKRIVAKVDELMAICDLLSKKICRNLEIQNMLSRTIIESVNA